MAKLYRQIRQKQLLILAGIPALLSGLLFSAMPAAQFYKPNREAHLFVTLKSKARYRSSDHVIVTVMLNNQSTEKLLINGRMLFNNYPANGEIAFMIEGPQDKPYPLVKIISSPHDVKESDLIVMNVGDTLEREADLTDMYALRKKGTYTVQVIYYNKIDLDKDGLSTWRGSLASEPTLLQIY